MSFDLTSLAGARVTVMGLGLHGGGVEAARYCARAGAEVTVTDMKSAAELEPSIKELADFSIRYILGGHQEEDFVKADLVIKNPAVPSTSPLLGMASRVETDISIFLTLASNPIIAVTGSKGKSTVVSAVHHCLKKSHPGARLGGNITVSPLSFLPELLKDTSTPLPPVVLELSSWQLADVKGRGLLKPHIAVITNILPDHQNRYSGMDDYIADKKTIYEGQHEGDWTIVNGDDPATPQFAAETKGRILQFTSRRMEDSFQGAWLEGESGFARIESETTELFGEKLPLPGSHNRLNLLCTGLILAAFGVDGSLIRSGLSSFTGIGHRLEMIATANGVSYYNDSAATIPHATAEALNSFSSPVHLILGGTDKNLDFSVLEPVITRPCSVHVLAGSAFNKIENLCRQRKVSFEGPFDNLEAAVDSACKAASPGDTVLLSPGCASFGMFKNEFHRGDEFRKIVETRFVETSFA